MIRMDETSAQACFELFPSELTIREDLLLDQTSLNKNVSHLCEAVELEATTARWIVDKTPRQRTSIGIFRSVSYLDTGPLETTDLRNVTNG